MTAVVGGHGNCPETAMKLPAGGHAITGHHLDDRATLKESARSSSGEHLAA